MLNKYIGSSFDDFLEDEGLSSQPRRSKVVTVIKDVACMFYSKTGSALTTYGVRLVTADGPEYFIEESTLNGILDALKTHYSQPVDYHEPEFVGWRRMHRPDAPKAE